MGPIRPHHLHYVRKALGESVEQVYARRFTAVAACGDKTASLKTLSLSDVQSIITCPRCREIVRKELAENPHMLALIENAWSDKPEEPVWDEDAGRWTLPSLLGRKSKPPKIVTTVLGEEAAEQLEEMTKPPAEIRFSMPYDGPADTNPFKPTIGTEVAICDHWPRPLHVNNRVELIPTTNVHWANLCRDCHALMGDRPNDLKLNVVTWTEEDAAGIGP